MNSTNRMHSCRSLPRRNGEASLESHWGSWENCFHGEYPSVEEFRTVMLKIIGNGPSKQRLHRRKCSSFRHCIQSHWARLPYKVSRCHISLAYEYWLIHIETLISKTCTYGVLPVLPKLWLNTTLIASFTFHLTAYPRTRRLNSTEPKPGESKLCVTFSLRRQSSGQHRFLGGKTVFSTYLPALATSLPRTLWRSVFGQFMRLTLGWLWSK